MPKRRSSGRAVFRQFDMESFLYRIIGDLSKYSDLSGAAERLALGGTEFRDWIASELSLAEEQRDDGGFTRYAILRQLDACVKKNASFRAKSDADCRSSALKKFWAAERKCARTNTRLQHFDRHWSRAPVSGQILNDAAVIIHDVLGEFGPDEYKELFDSAGPTNGASFDETRQMDLSFFAKLERQWTFTKNASLIIRDYLQDSPALLQYLICNKAGLKEVPGDRVSFVPKNWDIHRSIAVQPSWNVFLQKGVDCMMRKRLLRNGVDLRDQSLNHIPAAYGSVDNSYATIDLSSASDTVSIALVKKLLPRSWYEILDQLRARTFVLDKQTYEYHKFSAMGNCNTFPLETLIFWALAKACLRYANHKIGMLQVYGDDIVLPQAVYPLMIEVLQYAGFEPNRAKCFAFGTFRETCGCDFVYGIDIRPVYVKKGPASAPEVYNLYNRLLLNRLGLQLPATLSYLRGLVDRAHEGPCYALTSAEEGWYAGKSVAFDNYFISEPPSDRVWDMDLMTYHYEYTCIQKRSRKPLHMPRRATLYRTILMGYSSDARATNRDREVQKVLKTPYWPTLREALTQVTKARQARTFWQGDYLEVVSTQKTTV